MRGELLQSPTMMRSGVGQAGHLRAHGIGVRVDLPGVGANLADHGAWTSTADITGRLARPPSSTRAPFHSSDADSKNRS